MGADWHMLSEFRGIFIKLLIRSFSLIKKLIWMKSVICHRMSWKYVITYFLCLAQIQKNVSHKPHFLKLCATFFWSHINFLSYPLSISFQSATVHPHARLLVFLRSLTGRWVVRLSGHYMRHLFARCYCLHGADFIRYHYNFINSVCVCVWGGVSLYFLPQRRWKWRGKKEFCTWNVATLARWGRNISQRNYRAQ